LGLLFRANNCYFIADKNLTFIVMSIDEAISKATGEFSKAVEHLAEQFARLQIGKANSSLVENIPVELYGVTQPIKALANIAIPDARLIQIQPWDKSALGAIVKAVLASGTGLNPVNDGIVVRIAIPQLTEERRTELTKHVRKLAEESRITVRNARQDAHNSFKKLKADGDITEDDWHGADKRLQSKVDEFNKKIDEATAVKEKDVMTI